MTLTHIGPRPTDEMYHADGEIECQCARCGSSCDVVHCYECEDGYVEHDEGDDVVPEYVLRPCEICNGVGWWQACLSSPDWCEANPLPGREGVERGQIEWFVVERAEAGMTHRCYRCHEPVSPRTRRRLA